MILRLSQRLAKKVKVGKLQEMPLDDNPGADWTSRLFIVNRKQYIIISNTMSLYSCVMYGRGVTNRDLLVGKTLGALGEFMMADDQQHIFQRLVVPASDGVIFAKSLNRSVTGLMSDHVQGAKIDLDSGFDLHQIGFRLNDTPLSALIGPNGRKYGNPRNVFVHLTDKPMRKR